MNIKKEDCILPKMGFPCFIPAQKILHIISRKWTIQLFFLLQENQKLRYNEIRHSLQKGWKNNKISDSTLSARLTELTEEGLLERKVFTEMPPKVEYSLTEEGRSLTQALEPLMKWAIEICHKHLKIED